MTPTIQSSSANVVAIYPLMPILPESSSRRPPVQFDRREREVAHLMRIGRSTKWIAAELELAVQTVNRRISRMCDRVRVLDRNELLVWIRQNPACHDAGQACQSGLHARECACEVCRVQRVA